MKHAIEAHRLHSQEANDALRVYRTWCAKPLPAVPGMATAPRLAVRIANGLSIEEAAGREYLYRWNLALTSSRCFGVPHPLGM
ncbi:MAG: hypothetical protein JJU26_13060 [Oceanicaulis sp.]|uniref:hypothetical protein n=1 Tax=Glycocaulis sp. TaxID=1969725 RepID=UPI0025BE3B44|nr:hypothetical protein [Glycocaulis sp.]MCC5982635.1 hypothetical protein [Oceanicaulis sp.]MCH8522362.1 hypothetical protein [Glycocaulis sp.]